MSNTVRLALGGAQFGMAYGIANRRGQLDQEMVTAVLGRALDHGIDMVDTASAYGDSETAIGESLRRLPQRLCVVTKTPSFGGKGIGTAEISAVRTAFEQSRRRLGTQSVYALLVHDVGDLLGSGADLLAELLCEVKARGQAEKIGVSVYEPWEVAAACERLAPDVVQLPLNVLDQRFVSDGTLPRLARSGIEVHVRSVFLQGVLLMAPDDVPAHLQGLREPLARFRRSAAQAGSTLLAAALAFVRATGLADRLVVGVTSTEELDEIVAAFAERPDMAFSGLAVERADLIDPRRWGPQ